MIPEVDLGPYKGPSSYEIADRHLFFGREQDAEQLASLVLAHPAMLLHAPSAAGKTSLLNARLIPELESLGWLAIRIRPQDDPIESTRTTTLATVLPPPALEVLSMRRALRMLTAGRDCALDDLLQEFDARAERSPDEVRRLVAPVTLTRSHAHRGLPAFGEVTPYFTRLLRSGIAIEQFAGYIALLGGGGEPVSGRTRVGELAHRLPRCAMRDRHRTLLEEAAKAGRELRPFFSHLVDLWDRWPAGASPQGMVLIFDQFEELFTRFVDPGRSGPRVADDTTPERAKWRLRKEFFRQLEELYASAAASERPEDAPGPARHLPIRFVVSMRDEYVAQLDELRRLPRDLERARYHLRLLEKHQAEAAICAPAEHAGYSYSRHCLRTILDGLVSENRFVEPSHIQIVCGKLWRKRGRDLAGADGTRPPRKRRWVPPRILRVLGGKRTGYSVLAPLSGEAEGSVAALCIQTGPKQRRKIRAREIAAARSRPPPGRRQLSVRTVRELGGIHRILSDSFPEYLAGLSIRDRTATLDILDGLLTSEQTRNVVEKERLLTAPFRNRERRNELLDKLIRRRFVREEKRSGRVFIEISHEFLIEPMLAALGSPESIDYREAIRTLERYMDIDFRFDVGHLLNPGEISNLHGYREQIEWPAWAVELMLRSIIYRHSRTHDPGLLREWATRYAACDPLPTGAEYLHRLPGVRRSTLTLSLEQLTRLDARDTTLGPEEVAIVLRSVILKAGTREQVIRWTQEVLAHAT